MLTNSSQSEIYDEIVQYCKRVTCDEHYIRYHNLVLDITNSIADCGVSHGTKIHEMQSHGASMFWLLSKGKSAFLFIAL